MKFESKRGSTESPHPEPIFGSSRVLKSPERPTFLEICYNSTSSSITKLNPFTPEFMKWTRPSPNLVTSIVANRGFSQKSMADWQPVQIQMRRLVTSRLISIYTFYVDIILVCWDEMAMLKKVHTRLRAWESNNIWAHCFSKNGWWYSEKYVILWYQFLHHENISI